MQQDLQPLVEALQRLDSVNDSEEPLVLLRESDFPPQQQPLAAQINKTIRLLDERSRREQKNLEIINNIIHSGMWSMKLDRESRITAVNWSKTFRRMLGFKEEEEFPNRLESWSDRLHPEDAGPTLEAYWAAVAGQQEYDVEYRLRTKSGEYRWYRATGEVSRREDGSPSLFLGIFVDITEQKRLLAEKQAAQAERERMRTELEKQNDVLVALCSDYASVYRVDLDSGDFEIHDIATHLRPGVEQIARSTCNYSQAMKAYAENFVLPEDRKSFLQAADKGFVREQLKKEPGFSIRYRVMPNDQGQEHYEMHFAAAHQGGENTAVLGFRNIDAMLRREQASEAETRHDIEETLEGSRTGLWVIELEEGCAPRMYADRTMRMLLGVTEKLSPEQCYLAWYDRIDPDYLPMVDQTVRDILEAGRSEVVYPWNHPQLGKIYVRCGGVPDQKFDRPGARLKGYHQDITETMVSKMRQEKALMEALMEAKQASRAKTEFLSHMSHDIRTPINGILGMLNISEKNPDDPVRQQDCRRKIRAAAQHLLSLINDVLDISKMESGSFELRHEPFVLPELLENCLSILRPQAEAEGLTLMERYSGLEDQYLVGSPLHLRQILINILGNAVKYNRPGGSVELCTEQNGRKDGKALLRFTVADTGIGMSDEFLKHIFEPFTQENASVRTNYQGTGLGMAITRRLVERMGGEIRVSSRLGEGSCFTIQLPLEIDTSHAAEASQPAEEAEPRVEGLRLLLAEDNELNREIAQYMLEDAGATVVNAVDGKQAVELFSGSVPGELDGILMDVMMPVMDGLEATRAIRALDRPDAKKIPIIAMTANAFAEDVEQCRKAGMNAHLAKPLDLHKMFATIAELCGGQKN